MPHVNVADDGGRKSFRNTGVVGTAKGADCEPREGPCDGGTLRQSFHERSRAIPRALSGAPAQARIATRSSVGTLGRASSSACGAQ